MLTNRSMWLFLSVESCFNSFRVGQFASIFATAIFKRWMLELHRLWILSIEFPLEINLSSQYVHFVDLHLSISRCKFRLWSWSKNPFWIMCFAGWRVFTMSGGDVKSSLIRSNTDINQIPFCHQSLGRLVFVGDQIALLPALAMLR